MKICFIPIDNRPVCYNLAVDIVSLDKSIDFYIPPREFLGDLIKNADVNTILDWLKNIPKCDAIILSLDTIAYGGLIPSRRSCESFEEIKDRIEQLKQILKEKDAKIYAFSSIMRISNNNYNEEEKEYWKDYGKKIFEYSFLKHKNKENGITPPQPSPSREGEDYVNPSQPTPSREGDDTITPTQTNLDIPQEILDDYLATRKRNFEINKLYLQWQKEGLFDTLIFSKDDCAEFGFNVEEAKELEKLGGRTKTGADEIPLSLLSRSIKKDIKVFVEFTEPDCKDLISNYEDVSIEKSVLGQLELGGFKTVTTQKDADLILIVNNFREKQGELVMRWKTGKRGKYKFIKPNKPFCIADVRYANGADNEFVEQILPHINSENFYGYSAWNTSANTLGSILAGAKIKFNANNYANNYAEKSFKKLQTIRFLDDWAYQANVREKIEYPSKIEDLMKPYEEKVFNALDYKPSRNIEYTYPWDRKFEIEIQI